MDGFGFLGTRRGLLVLAAGLLLLGLAFPASWGEGSQGSSSTALYVLGHLLRPDRFPAFAEASWRTSLLRLAVLANVAFLVGFGMRGVARPTPGLVALLTGAAAIDLTAALLLRDFSRLPGTWLWVAAAATVAWAFVSTPAAGPAPRGYWRQTLRGQARPGEERAGVPTLVVTWLVWLVFWAGVSFAGRWVKPGVETVTALTAYVEDTAGVLSPPAVERLTDALERFEKATSTQIAVAIYPGVPSVPVEEFTIRVADRSRLGRKGLDNGAILSVFVTDRVARWEVGYGLEAALPDAESLRLLETDLVPAWSRGERDAAIERTVAGAMGLVKDAVRAGKRPGRARLFLRQLTVEVPRALKGLLPTLVELPAGARVAISFWGSILLLAVWDGLVQTRRLLRILVRAFRNLGGARHADESPGPVELGSVIDLAKVVLVAGVLTALVVGAVRVAGGGAFGGAGAFIRW